MKSSVVFDQKTHDKYLDMPGFGAQLSEIVSSGSQRCNPVEVPIDDHLIIFFMVQSYNIYITDVLINNALASYICL